jgi:hypothetical protein
MGCFTVTLSSVNIDSLESSSGNPQRSFPCLNLRIGEAKEGVLRAAAVVLVALRAAAVVLVGNSRGLGRLVLGGSRLEC